MANRRRIIFGLAASAIALLGLVLPFSDTNQPVVPTPTEVNSTESQALQIYRDLPLLFIANKGQMDSHAEFYVKSSNHTLYLTRDSIIFDLFRPSQSREHNSGFPLVSGEIPPSTSEHLQFSLNFIGANNDMRVKGNDPAKAIVNHFVGDDPDRWRTNIPTYREILYEGIYPNIDLRLYGKQGSINYDFIVHPGGNVADIKLAYAGVSNTRLHEAGMTAETLFGDIEQSQPFIYQQTGDAQVEVAGSFGLLDANTYGFQVATYDVSLPLVIDPSLVYSTYLGGSLKDGGTGIAADSSGCAYIVGATSSTDFPLRNAYQGTLGDGNWGDAFVTKIDTTKTGNDSLIYSTYLGGNDQDFGLDIAVDTNGCAYVTGYTSSTNFPTTPNAFQSVHRGTYDAFVAKLSASGSALEYSTYLGGNGRDEAHGIAIDSTGNAYVSGVTSSTNFPTTPNAFQSAHGGTSDAFVAKLSANGSALEYSTYLGGSGNDPSADIAVDSTGCAYVVGLTSSTNFPVQNPIQVYRGNIDIFVTKFSASGSAVIYSTYLGGGGYDGFAGGALLMFGGIAVDPQGCAYITGFTVSADFPTTPNAYQPTIAGSRDVFVSKLNAPGTALDYSTYLGGSDEEYGCDIAVDSDSCAYVVGITVSTDFPTMNPLQTCNHAYGKTNNAFVSKIDMGKTGADGLMFSTYLNDDFGCVGTAIAVDQMDSAYVTGVPAGNNFPIKNAYQPFRVLDWDAFVAKIETATLNRPPNIPSNPSPANYAAPVLPGVTLSWDGGDPDAGDTMTYDVYLGRCLGMQWAKVSANQTGTTFDTNSIVIPWLLPLWPNTRYYWRIVARDNSGAEAYGPNWTFFTTSISPSAVTGDVINLEPEGTSENVTFRATLTGNLTSLGTFASADVWFQLSYQPLPGKRDISIPTPTMRMDAEGAFSIDVTGLPPGQKFSFRSMAAPANPAAPPT
ncbi:MAG: hypothetical protein FJZ93_09130, partial [Chloroflexi bacterium]|nr:hypothetical protein [Chloroflexota bacterium]